MSYDPNDGDLVLCVDARPNHVTGEAVPLIQGETYTIYGVLPFMCPCGRSDALIDVGVDFAWCQSRFRLLPRPRKRQAPKEVSAPKELEKVGGKP